MEPSELIPPVSTAKVKLLPTGFTLDYYYTHILTLEEGKTHHITRALLVPSISSPPLPLLKTLVHPQWSITPAPPKHSSLHSLLFWVLQLGFGGFSLERLPITIPAEAEDVLLILYSAPCFQHSSIHMCDSGWLYTSRGQERFCFPRA